MPFIKLHLCRQFHADEPKDCHYQFHEGDPPTPELTPIGSIVFPNGCFAIDSEQFEAAYPHLRLPPGAGPIELVATLVIADNYVHPSMA